MTTLPPRDHVVVGVKLTVMVQLALTAMGAAVQLLTWEKSPVAMMLLTVKLAVPVLLNVIGVLVPVEPTSTPLKLTLGGAIVAMGATPVPLIATLWGLPLALSITFAAEDLLPVLVGLKVTLIVQLAFAAKDEGQVLVSEKSPVLPLEILTPVIVNDAVPVFVTVMTWAALTRPTC